jgi:hypothetical protein
MNGQRGDSPAGGAPSPVPVAASTAVNELPTRTADPFAELGAPESGPHLKPNESLAPEAYAAGQVLAGK